MLSHRSGNRRPRDLGQELLTSRQKAGAADHTAPAGNPPATTAPKPVRSGCRHAGKLDRYGVRVAFTTVNNRVGMVPVMLAVTVVVPATGVFGLAVKFTVVPPAGTPAS